MKKYFQSSDGLKIVPFSKVYMVTKCEKREFVSVCRGRGFVEILCPCSQLDDYLYWLEFVDSITL